MIQEVTMYTVICDNCQKDSCQGTEYAAWCDKSVALDIASDADFVIQGDKHYCSECYYYDDDNNLQLKSNS